MGWNGSKQSVLQAWVHARNVNAIKEIYNFIYLTLYIYNFIQNSETKSF